MTIGTALVAPAFVFQSPSIKPADLNRLTGDQWSGTLTYVDSQSGRRIPIPSTLLVKRADWDRSAWTFEYGYPKEPQANGAKTLKLSADGSALADEKVIERTETHHERSSLRWNVGVLRTQPVQLVAVILSVRRAVIQHGLAGS